MFYGNDLGHSIVLAKRNHRGGSHHVLAISMGQAHHGLGLKRQIFGSDILAIRGKHHPSKSRSRPFPPQKKKMHGIAASRVPCLQHSRGARACQGGSGESEKKANKHGDPISSYRPLENSCGVRARMASSLEELNCTIPARRDTRRVERKPRPR